MGSASWPRGRVRASLCPKHLLSSVPSDPYKSTVIQHCSSLILRLRTLRLKDAKLGFPLAVQWLRPSSNARGAVVFFFPFIFISWRPITLQYCSGFCHTLTWVSHGVTCIPHPDPCSHLSLHPIPLGLPSAPGLSTCLMHPAWADNVFHPW